MRNKKAQLTLIIAIAIFIFIISALIFYVANYYKSKNPVEPLVFEKAVIENYINRCVKKTAEEGLKLFGKQGFAIGNFKVPSIEYIQNELSSYTSNNLNVCLKDFNEFKKQGWDIEKSSISTKTQINQEDVMFEISFPIKISDKGNTINFERFIVTLNIRLKYIYDLVNNIVDFNSKYKRQVDMTMLNDYDVNVTIFDYEDSLIYVIDDPKSLIINEPFRVMLELKS